MHRTDFYFDLPDAQIAQAPLPLRDASRLLVVAGPVLRHFKFFDIEQLLRPGDLLVVNDTRVINARLKGSKDTGGAAEILVERILADDHFALCQVRVSKPLKPGRKLTIDGQTVAVVGRVGEFYELRFPVPVLDFLSAHGEVPLPPYIERSNDAADELRYQTVYSEHPGAVAAPTAGLHFSESLLERLADKGVGRCSATLHVGAGTFQPVRVDDITAHRMHYERYQLSQTSADQINATREAGHRVIAVGTTVVRTLEACARVDGLVMPGAGETNLFITPGYRFRAIDALVTNFHLPESTLLMLVCAFHGYEHVMAAYRAAVAERYRFFSYGDAMFCEVNHV